MSFGENIKKQRLALGMTLEEVADKVGVTRQTMSRYETGKINNYSPETISKIAEALDTTAACLIGYDESEISTGIGEKIKALRLKNGLTLDEIAQKIGVNNATVSRWETGEIKAIGSDKIGALADILGTTTEYLLGRSKFAENLRKLRKNQGWKQEEVANLLGLSKQVISTYEIGARSPSLETLIRIAELFDVSIDYLLRADNKCDMSRLKDLTDSSRKIGERIGTLRKDAGLTLDDVATALGTIRQTVYKYEHGIVSNIPAKNIVKLAQLFNVSSDYILGLSEKTNYEEARLKGCPFLDGESFDEQSSNVLLEKRGTLIGELKILRKAVDEINKTLDSLGVRE